jgi:hypothetical protein
VLAVKIDNILQARSQTGLSKVAIVCVLPVEGGSRPSADGGTTFTTASGQLMTFAAGPVWVVLAAR